MMKYWGNRTTSRNSTVLFLKRPCHPRWHVLNLSSRKCSSGRTMCGCATDSITYWRRTRGVWTPIWPSALCDVKLDLVRRLWIYKKHNPYLRQTQAEHILHMLTVIPIILLCSLRPGFHCTPAWHVFQSGYPVDNATLLSSSMEIMTRFPVHPCGTWPWLEVNYFCTWYETICPHPQLTRTRVDGTGIVPWPLTWNSQVSAMVGYLHGCGTPTLHIPIVSDGWKECDFLVKSINTSSPK